MAVIHVYVDHYKTEVVDDKTVAVAFKMGLNEPIDHVKDRLLADGYTGMILLVGSDVDFLSFDEKMLNDRGWFRK